MSDPYIPDELVVKHLRSGEVCDSGRCRSMEARAGCTCAAAADAIDRLQTANGYLLGELNTARAEIGRLQEAKRRALAIADERSRENVALKADIAAYRNVLEIIAGATTDQLQAVQAKAALTNIGRTIEQAKP